MTTSIQANPLHAKKIPELSRSSDTQAGTAYVWAVDGRVRMFCLWLIFEEFWWRWGHDEGKQASFQKKRLLQICSHWGNGADPVGCLPLQSLEHFSQQWALCQPLILELFPMGFTHFRAKITSAGPAITCLLKFCTMKKMQSFTLLTSPQLPWWFQWWGFFITVSTENLWERQSCPLPGVK